MRKYHSGLYQLKNPDKYIGDKSNITWRSSWELKVMRWADENPNVIRWGSEIVVIKYFYTVDQRVHRYFVDFAMQVRKKSGEIENLIIEVKPLAETQAPVRKRNTERFIRESLTWQKNQDKWKAAKAWAEENNYRFIILTEADLGIAK